MIRIYYLLLYILFWWLLVLCILYFVLKIENIVEILINHYSKYLKKIEHSQSRQHLCLNRQSRQRWVAVTVGPKWLTLIRSAQFKGPRWKLIGRPRFWVGAIFGPTKYSYVIGWELDAGPPTIHPRGVSGDWWFLWVGWGIGLTWWPWC